MRNVVVIFFASLLVWLAGCNPQGSSDSNPNANTTSTTAMAVSVAPEIPINTCAPVSVTWVIDSVPVQDVPIAWSITRGTLYRDDTCSTQLSGTVMTNSSGTATVYVISSNNGPSNVTATGATTTTTNTFEFVATTPASLSLNFNRTVVAPGDDVVCTATVRDPSDNLVKNAVVEFTVAPSIGGDGAPLIAATDSLGRATVTLIAPTPASVPSNFAVTATVQGTEPAITDSLAFTVDMVEAHAQVAIGMANSLSSINAAAYGWTGVVQVVDVGGYPVADMPVSMRFVARSYDKGTRRTYEAMSDIAQSNVTADTPTYLLDPLSCANEDLNENGLIDAGEDINGDGVLSPGAMVAVMPATGTTDASGMVTFQLVYPKDYADWVRGDVIVSLGVGGVSKSYSVLLPMSVVDIMSPPGMTSPYGTANSCSVPN